MATTTEHKKHTGHRVLPIAPHVWFCGECIEQFDGEPAKDSGPAAPKPSIAESTEREL